MQTLFEDSDLTITYDSDHDWLLTAWRGRRSPEASMHYCWLLLEKIRATGSTCVLNDSSQDLDGWSEVTRWLGQDFFLRLTSNGISAVAWVLPLDLRARADVNQVMAQVGTNWPAVDTFTDVEAAYAWLLRTTAPRAGKINC
ncbi:hypothetical protein [Hymenobacter psoromatis]|uniref:hypothetical protein n=1 Tax=Hymenobacter psoromatis TaxID=1484116 RepID=UPI001CBEBF5B|nr:hypothetical protein [Hymenobacter psoromatis]